MSEELQKPPVIDFDLLLRPISEESPSGEEIRYSGIHDEIREARRADDVLDRGEWQTDLKVADFQKVLNLGVDTLCTKSKDLQVAAWLTEALVRLHGFTGLRDGLRLLAGIQETFWETLYPEIDEGDMENRANAIEWVDTHVGFALRSAPFTGVARYSYRDWEDSKQFEIPDNMDSLPSADKERINALLSQAEREHRVTGDLWKKEIEQTRRAAVEASYFAIEECGAALAELNRVIEEKFDRNQAPGLSSFQKSLEDVKTQVKLLLAQKREEEPDEELDADEEGSEGEVGADGVVIPGKATAAGALQNRKDALRRLSDIADFFKKTEPHSPVSYLVQRAVKWGDMSMDNWLQEVVKDQSVLFQLRETLGVAAENGSDYS